MEDMGIAGVTIDPMDHAVNRMMGNAVEETMDAETKLAEASVHAQVGAVSPPVPDAGEGQVFNAWA